MSKYGKYDPTATENTSDLFTYGEVPVASNKLNRWNANIEASLNWAVECLTILAGARENDFVLYEASGVEMKVAAQSPPDMTVKVNPGRAIVANYFCGIESESTLPSAGLFTAPSAQPRYDLIYIDRAGNLGVVAGVEDASPSVPSAPANTLTLAHLYMRPGMSSVKDSDDSTNGYIIDQRPVLVQGRAHNHNSDRAPTESADGIRTNFSTANQFVEGSLEVFVNGLLQSSGTEYTPDADRNGYTFTVAPPSGYRIEHRYLVEE